MSCQMRARVSSALAATEFHSLSPPCDHSVETPGPLIPQPGALAAGSSRYEGFRRASCRAVCEMPRMFSASYHRYSACGCTVGDCERTDCEKEETRKAVINKELVRRKRNRRPAVLASFAPLRENVLRTARYPNASRHSASLRCRQVNIGVSRRVNELALVSRSSWTRSRKSDGWSVSNATTNSWSSSSKE